MGPSLLVNCLWEPLDQYFMVWDKTPVYQTSLLYHLLTSEASPHRKKSYQIHYAFLK